MLPNFFGHRSNIDAIIATVKVYAPFKACIEHRILIYHFQNIKTIKKYE